MGTIEIFCCLVCFTFFGSNWGNDRNIIRKENDYEKVIGIARKEIGVREEAAENSGERVKNYLEHLGIKSPAPWCAAFVSFCFGKAGYAEPRTAWSPALFPDSRLVKPNSRDASHSFGMTTTGRMGIIPGLVYGIYFANLKRIGHCGLTESIRNSWCTGIEGNTNLAGDREGDGVFRRIRHTRTIFRFADWVKE